MSCGEHRGKPQRTGVAASVAVRIEGIHAVILSRNKHGIVRLSADSYVRKIERLSVRVSVNGLRKEFAKLRGVYIGWIQNSLIEVLPGPRNVIAPGSNTDLGVQPQITGRQK